MILLLVSLLLATCFVDLNIRAVEGCLLSICLTHLISCIIVDGMGAFFMNTRRSALTILSFFSLWLSKKIIML